MWISREKYEVLKRIADNNRRDADMFRALTERVSRNTIIHHSDFVIMSREAYDVFLKKFSSSEDEIKDIKAELEWYKVKYYEMKMKL